MTWREFYDARARDAAPGTGPVGGSGRRAAGDPLPDRGPAAGGPSGGNRDASKVPTEEQA